MDFTKKQFSRTLRGYSPEDVDSYIALVSDEYGKLRKQSAENERRLVFALRKLESLTKELQSIYSSTEHADEATEADGRQSEDADLSAARAELREVSAELERAKAELAATKTECEKIRTESEERARALLGAARSRADAITVEAQAKSDGIVAQSAKKARAAAEQIITDAALASKKIIRDAEAKADNACRDLTTIYTAAERMYREVSEFRGDIFALYSSHINSIESISGSANGMIDSVNKIVERLESGDDGQSADASTETDDERGALVFEEVAEPIEPEQTYEESAAGEEIAVLSDPKPMTAVEDADDADENADEDEDESEEREEDRPLGDLYITVRDEDGEYYDSFDSIPDEDDDGTDVPDERAGDGEDESLPWDDGEDAQEETDGKSEPLPWDDGGDDFEISDDLQSGTNVLDIVKKLGGGKNEKRPAEDDDGFFDVGALLGDDGVTAEEFRRAFSDKKEGADIDEIMRQPDSHPTAPTNPKKHSKF